MRRILIWLLSALAIGAALAPLATPRAFAAAPAKTGGGTTQQLPDSAEAWYATAPVVGCSAPVGCPPAAPANAQSYPANTLHVSVVAGQETARSYLEPDFLALPLGATLTSAVLTVPVDTAANSGNQNLSSAKLIACLVTAAFADGTSGSTGPEPSVDCGHSIPVTYVAKHNDFTVNLAGYLPQWNSGSPEFGVALLPAPGEGATANWQVSIDGEKLAHQPHATTVVNFLPPSAIGAGLLSGPGSVPPATGLTGPAAGTVPLPPGGNSALAGAPPVAGTAPLVAGPPGRTPATAPAALRGSFGFQYPEVMLLPLALLVGVVFVARLLTSDATPRRLAR